MRRWCRGEESNPERMHREARGQETWCVLVPVSWSSARSGWLACRSAQQATATREAIVCCAFCCRTSRPSCLNRKMTLALGLCVLSNWHTNTPWAKQQICIKVMNQSHFASCRLPGTGSIVAASGVTAQSQAGAHIADLLSVCEVAAGGLAGWGLGSRPRCNQQLKWKKIK